MNSRIKKYNSLFKITFLAIFSLGILFQVSVAQGGSSWLFYDTEEEAGGNLGGSSGGSSNRAGSSGQSSNTAYLESVNTYHKPQEQQKHTQSQSKSFISQQARTNTKGINSFNNLQSNSKLQQQGNYNNLISSQNSFSSGSSSSGQKLGTFQQSSSSRQYGSSSGAGARGSQSSQLESGSQNLNNGRVQSNIGSSSKISSVYSGNSASSSNKKIEKDESTDSRFTKEGLNKWLYADIPDEELQEHAQQVQENIEYNYKKQVDHNMNLRRKMELQKQKEEQQKQLLDEQAKRIRQNQEQQLRIQQEQQQSQEYINNDSPIELSEYERQQQQRLGDHKKWPKHHHRQNSDLYGEGEDSYGSRKNQKNPPSDVRYSKKWLQSDYSKATRNNDCLSIKLSAGFIIMLRGIVY